jgi:hypothetical protein
MDGWWWKWACVLFRRGWGDAEEHHHQSPHLTSPPFFVPFHPPSPSSLPSPPLSLSPHALTPPSLRPNPAIPRLPDALLDARPAHLVRRDLRRPLLHCVHAPLVPGPPIPRAGLPRPANPVGDPSPAAQRPPCPAGAARLRA